MQEYRKKVCVQGLQNFFTSKLAGERGGQEIVGTVPLWTFREKNEIREHSMEYQGFLYFDWRGHRQLLPSKKSIFY